MYFSSFHFCVPKGLTRRLPETTLRSSPHGRLMSQSIQNIGSRLVLAVVPLSAMLCLCPPKARCQDSGDQGMMIRGDRAEISVSVRDSSGSVVTVPATVKLNKNGMPSDQTSTSHGRAFFIPRGLGDFTIVVEAAGYKSAQKDISLTVSGKYEVDIYLQRELASNESVGAPGKPILAPEAQKAFAKGTQALRDGKLDEAEKELTKAATLAPANPGILYVQGMLYLRQRNWEKAESVLEKSDQLEPNQASVLSALGMALCNGQKYEKAIGVLEKSIELEPNASWETDWALAKAYYFREQYDQALKMARQAHTTSHGTSPQAELLLAQCLTAMGRFEEAAEILREFLKSNTQGPDAVTARRWLDNLTADGKIHP
jgi:Flp pilus assembly protein TadD